MKKILLFLAMLFVCNIGYAQLGINNSVNEDNTIAMILNDFTLGKYNDTYIICINGDKFNFHKEPKYIIINLGKGKDSAIQSIALLLNMCKNNTIEGTTITDYEGNKFNVSSMIFPNHQQRILKISTDEFMISCFMTEDALEFLLYKLNKQ